MSRREVAGVKKEENNMGTKSMLFLKTFSEVRKSLIGSNSLDVSVIKGNPQATPQEHNS